MWCIWYVDGTTFSSDDGNPEDAPGAGVVVIAQDGGSHDDPYVTGGQQWKTVSGYDWYIYDQGFWFSTNMQGLTQYITEPGAKIIKAGRWVPPAVYNELRSKAAKWGF